MAGRKGNGVRVDFTGTELKRQRGRNGAQLTRHHGGQNLGFDNHEQMGFAREGKKGGREEEEGILLNHRITSKVILSSPVTLGL